MKATKWSFGKKVAVGLGSLILFAILFTSLLAVLPMTTTLRRIASMLGGSLFAFLYMQAVDL